MIGLLAATFLAATATAGVRAQRVEVGDPVEITVRVTARPGAMVTLFPPASQPPAFDVPEGAPRLLQADGNGIVAFTYSVVPWVDGETEIPPARVEVAGGDTLVTNRVALKAFNPLGSKAKDEKPADIRDIRPFPVRFPIWIWAVLGAIAAGAWLAFRRRRPKPVALPPGIPVPPPPSLADAIDAVRRIAEQPPRDRPGIREAHFVVAEAVRRFVEERWEVPASKQTTEEFLEALAARGPRSRGAVGGLRTGLGIEMLPAVLEACDRVKWAGDDVGPDDTVQLAKTALEFFAASRGAIRGLGGPEAGARVDGAGATGSESRS